MCLSIGDTDVMTDKAGESKKTTATILAWTGGKDEDGYQKDALVKVAATEGDGDSKFFVGPYMKYFSFVSGATDTGFVEVTSEQVDKILSAGGEVA